MNIIHTGSTGTVSTGTGTGTGDVGTTGRIRAASRRVRHAVLRRLMLATSGDAGMSTVEYAVGTIAAAAFGAVLYTVVSGDSIPDALGGIIERALNTSV